MNGQGMMDQKVTRRSVNGDFPVGIVLLEIFCDSLAEAKRRRSRMWQ